MSMNAHGKAWNPATIALYAVGVVALGVSIVLAGVSVSVVDPAGADVARSLMLSAWSNYLVLLATIASVGATVLVGVRWLFRRAVPAATPESLTAERDESPVI